MEKQGEDSLCRSIFRDGEEAAVRRRFTQRWAETISRMEREKRYASLPRPERPAPGMKGMGC